MSQRISIIIVSGYSGAGKTTLIKQLVKDETSVTFVNYHPLTLSLIENIQNKRRRKKLVLDSTTTHYINDLYDLVSILEQEKTNKIIIELGSIANPDIFVEEFLSILENHNLDRCYKIENVITVIDANHFWLDFTSGDCIVDSSDSNEEEYLISDVLTAQIEFCNTIVINKCTGQDLEHLSELQWFIKKLQPKAALYLTNDGRVNLNQVLHRDLFNLEQTRTSAGWIQELIFENSHLKVIGEYGIGSFIYKRDIAFEKERFLDWIKNFPQEILRSKGKVYLSTGETFNFSQAGPSLTIEEIDDTLIDSNKTELVIIGFDLDYQQIVADLDQCLCSISIPSNIS